MSPIVFQNVLMPNPTGGPDILTSSIPAGTQGTFYTFAMTATGGTLPYVWSLASGTLDSGVTLSAAGIISGTPVNAETDNITIRVTDAHGLFITKAFTVTFNPAVNPLTITTASPLPTGTEFNAYTTNLAATGGSPPYTWSIISGAFQTGITLSAAGVVSGTPTQSGTDTVTIQVQDSVLATTSKVFNLTITAPAPLTITTTSPLPSGTSGVFYSTTLNATGGITPYIWTILSGALQTGLTLTTGGIISGTPSVANTSTVTIQVKDNVNTTTSKTFSIITSASTSVFIAVSGNKFVNQSGTTLVLKGANNSGLELCGPFGEHPWGGNPPSFALMQQWGFNITRLPVNSASWLGLTTFSTSGSAFGTQNNAGVGNGTQDPFGDYKASILTYITGARAVNMYTVIDLHWGSNRITIGGVTHDVSYQGQLAFMDTTGFTFWCDPTLGFVAWLATNFGSSAFNTANNFNGGLAGANFNPAFGGPSGFGDIVFELFNEPFMGNAGETYAAGSADLALLNGGIVNKYVTNFGPPNITTNVTLAGYQSIVNGIRALGATNVIIVNGNQYSQNLQNFQTWRPTDSASQIGFGNHPYPQNSYPYTSSPNFQFPLVGNDSGGPPNWSTHISAILTAGFPIMITEDGGESGTAATSAEPHITYTTGVAAANNIPFMAWTFGGQDFYQASGTTSALNVLLRHNPGNTALWPLLGYGQTYYFFTSGNSAPIVTTASPLPSGGEGTAYSQTLTASGGAGAPFTWVKISDTGTGLTLSAAGVLSGTMTTTIGTYSIVVQATDQFGIQTAQKTLSLSATASPPGLPGNLTLTNQNVNSQSLSWTAAPAGANPVNHYKVYRNGVVLPAGGNVTTLTFTDSTATNSQQNNTFAPSTVYAYSVSAVDSIGVEGPIQTQCTFWMYQNGVANQSQTNFSFNATPNWADNTGAPPVGTLCISFSFPAGGAGFQPCSDTPMDTIQFGAELGAFNFFQIDCKLTDATHTFFLSHLSRPGYPGSTDFFALAQAPNFLTNLSSNYGTPSTTNWFTLKVPLSVLTMGTTVFNGFISGTTVTKVGAVISGPGADAGGYITGSGVAAGTFINAQPGNAAGPWTVNNSQTVGSAGSPVQLTCVRNNMYKLSFGMNSEPSSTKVYMNNLRWTVS